MTGPPSLEPQGAAPDSPTPAAGAQPAPATSQPYGPGRADSSTYPEYEMYSAAWYGAPGAGYAGYHPAGWMWNGYQWVPAAYAAVPQQPPPGPYERMRGKATIATVLYALSVGGLVFGIVALLHRYSLVSRLSDGTVTVSEADSADNLVAAAWGIWLFTLALAAIALLVFLHGAQRNNRVLGAYELRFTPGWVVGWSLIPLVNLVMHWIVLSDVEKTSRDPRGRPILMSRAGLRVHPAVVVLVLVAIVNAILSGVGASYGNNSVDTVDTLSNLIDRLHAHDGIFAGVFALYALSNALYVVIVRRVLANQEQAARSIGLQP